MNKIVSVEEKIIEKSIKRLQEDGLKFSIDSVAESLQISKKTIYKCFPSKEKLASAIYDAFYSKLESGITDFLSSFDSSYEEKISILLRFYHESSLMKRDAVFNKFNINGVIRDGADKRHQKIWGYLVVELGKSLSLAEIEAFRILVDGSFEKLESDDVKLEVVVKLLARIALCSKS